MQKLPELRVGLEIHQELNTGKLFCNCKGELDDAPHLLIVKRRLRPTQSELGEVDRAALAEAIKGKAFRYEITKNSCLVELDCEPPHTANEKALDAALEISLLLNATPVDEIHTMRKIVIDGSNTAGFQRTMLVATDGFVEADGKRYSIKTICLEEDAARKMGEDEHHVVYRLDRLGIPLVEVATGAEFTDPETPAKVALRIGHLMRATGKVRRGIGTIRQDINISIAGGARQEIKGIQELALIPEVIRREVQRQVSLLEIRDELRRRGAARIEPKLVDVSQLFSGTASQVLRKAIERGEIILAVLFPRFGGLLGKEIQPGRRFGTELADVARIYGKVGGIFHTDELPGHGITEAEVETLRRAVGASTADAVVLVAGERESASKALEMVIQRANMALDGVPEETRRALPDGNTEFMRPLPGAARMYPETDIPPIAIAAGRLKKIKAGLPELPEKKVERFMSLYRLSRELAEKVVFSEDAALFESLVKKTGAEPKLVATTLLETMVSLRREGVRTEEITEEQLQELLASVASGKIAKEALPEILQILPEVGGVEEAIKRLGISPLGLEEVEMAVEEEIKKNLELVRRKGMEAAGALMGSLMKKLRGRVDGKIVHDLLRKKLEAFIDQN